MIALIRHAEAVPHGDSDASRVLSDRGIAQANAQAEWLSHHVPSDIAVIHSPYMRAVQTAHIFARMVKGHCIPDEALAAHRQTEDVVQTIMAYALDDVIVVGHLPTIAEALAIITESALETFIVTPCTVALLHVSSRATMRFHLRAFVPPELCLP